MLKAVISNLSVATHGSQRKAVAMRLGIALLCSALIVLSGCAVTSEVSTIPSPTEAAQASVTPSLKPAGEFAPCAGASLDAVSAALACLTTPSALTPSHPVSLVFHFDPALHPSAAKRFEETANWALPYLNGYFTDLKAPAEIHLVVPLSSKWCGTIVASFDYGSPTAEATEKSYLCSQDGGANGGHASSENQAFVVVRPPLNEIQGWKSGGAASKLHFFYGVLAGEMGHASRSLMMEAYTGELGGQPYWPIWAQYMPNELLFYASNMRFGTDPTVARADRIWWMCERKATWKADYGDRRLIGWEAGSSGIYGCPGGPGDQSNVDAPNHYNMAFVAGEYFVAKYGLVWLLQTFMYSPLKTRTGLGVRDLDRAAAELGYDSWRAIEEELNQNLVTVLRTFGAELP
jgi:hypothetical protein